MTAQIDPGLIEAIQTAVQEALNAGPEKMLRRAEVEAMTGLSCAELYRQMHKGFPRPYKITNRKSVAWKQSEVQAWIAKLDAA